MALMRPTVSSLVVFPFGEALYEHFVFKVIFVFQKVEIDPSTN